MDTCGLKLHETTGVNILSVRQDACHFVDNIFKWNF